MSISLCANLFRFNARKRLYCDCLELDSYMCMKVVIKQLHTLRVLYTKIQFDATVYDEAI